MKKVFDVSNTAGEVIELILWTDSYDAGPKVGRIESPEEWTDDKIKERVQFANQDKGTIVECDK